ncbi:HalOD1 output domain-containing protein [Natronolimnobius sp. AArcel1]|uniref:HalOD1 output domain-containing protein n=1 Tax=Natronolimnobius sp. AArcel1 TaxID=1679093 RepID=UPI0031B6D5A2
MLTKFTKMLNFQDSMNFECYCEVEQCSKLITSHSQGSCMGSGAMTVYRGCTPVVDAQYEADGEQTPVAEIIDAVATAADVEPVELPPLYEFIDADSLNNLFQHKGAADSETILGFRIDHWNVFVRGDGRIRVCDGTQPTDPQPVFGSPAP